jgi:nucleoside-diphosphate-sugar epimerase
MTTSDFDIVIFGASGGTGTHVLNQAIDRGLRVLGLDHAVPDRAKDDGAIHRQIDVLRDDLTEHLDDGTPVISALGLGFSPGNMADPPPLYTEGTANIIKAMTSRGASRLCLVSAAFVEDDERVPAWFRRSVVPALSAILDEMREMEQSLEESGLDWTAARPGWLLDKPRSGSYEVEDRRLPEGVFRTRHADLAHFLLEAALTDGWIGAKQSLGRAENAFDESPAALSRELAAMVGIEL